MITLDEARQFALSLPEVEEAPHHDKASFRVRNRIFATVPPDGTHVHLLVGEPEARAFLAEGRAEGRAGWEELWWGQRLAGLRVDLRTAEADTVRELLEEAWAAKAPPALAATRRAPSSDAS